MSIFNYIYRETNLKTLDTNNGDLESPIVEMEFEEDSTTPQEHLLKLEGE